LTSEKVLDDFSNLKFIEQTLTNCDKNCYEKYNSIYLQNENNEYFNFSRLKGEVIDCTEKCEEIYRKIIDHQVKGAEISYVSCF
jgi:hypothetical protein